MKRALKYLLLVSLGMPLPSLCCDCRAAKPACAYVSADAIFLGRVSFTDDDGSGKFTQATLVRFDVEEHFKGLAEGDRQVWVDPGSFTSCYENYRLGERYLIFAARKTQLPHDSATMAIVRDAAGRRKPLPPGFDSKSPPPVYVAPECAGSRSLDYPSIHSDLAMLRAYRSGLPLPRVLGNVYLNPFRGWPEVTGPRMKGAYVTMHSSNGTTIHASTDADGNFSLTTAPVGIYNVWAKLAPYTMGPQVIMHVPEVGCGYADVALTTTSAVSGIVLNNRGRPVPKVPVLLTAKDRATDNAMGPWSLRTVTDEGGQFEITGVPDVDLNLSAGSNYQTTEMPYVRVYYPRTRSRDSAAVMRLKPGQRRDRMVIWLEPPLERMAVKVRVAFPHGAAAQDAFVRAFDDGGVIAEFARTDRNGIAALPCLGGLHYSLEAQFRERRKQIEPTIFSEPFLTSRRTSFVCGEPGATVSLTLQTTNPH